MRERGLIILGDKRGYRRSSGKLIRRLSYTFTGVFLVSYLFWAMDLMNERTQIKQALVDISRIEHATRLFRADHGRCPDDLEELNTPPGKRKYLELIQDPWEQPYRLNCPARFDPGGVEVMSGGPDQSLGGEDNISSL